MKPFVTAKDIAQDLGVSKQRVHQIIKNQNLAISKIGNMLLVDKESYLAYLKLRKRRGLAGKAGRKEVKFIRTAIHDTVCESCGAFAVNWKGTVVCENRHNYIQEE